MLLSRLIPTCCHCCARTVPVTTARSQSFTEPWRTGTARSPFFNTIIIWEAAFSRESATPPRATTERWREVAHANGLGELYLCMVEGFAEDRRDPRHLGFDAAVEFQPDWINLSSRLQPGSEWRIIRKVKRVNQAYIENYICDYAETVESMLRKPKADYKRFPGVTPSFDNTARRTTGAVIIHGSTPELYEKWLRATIDNFTPYSPDENLLFINAWNEWAEGNHLEPCQRWGLGVP